MEQEPPSKTRKSPSNQRGVKRTNPSPLPSPVEQEPPSKTRSAPLDPTERPSDSRSGGAEGEEAFESATQPSMQQVTEALELRHRFRVATNQLLPIMLLAADTSNRDGIPVNGHRCDHLLGDVCLMGYDPKEAAHDNVCVQVRPGDTTLLVANRETCAASEFLANIEVESLSFGTLSHSHLHQCLKNIVGRAKAFAPAGFCSDGYLDIDVVRKRQPLLADACANGLTWEVLHWRIRDEPGACVLIQSVCNRKGSAQMRETELQAVARLSMIATRLSKTGDGKVGYGAAKRALMASMPEIAESNDFVGMLRFVVSLGADQAPFIGFLKQFVGMKGNSRHVKATLFAEASRLPSTIPHLIIGMILMAYTAPQAYFMDGYSRFVNVSDFKLLVTGGERPEATRMALAGEKILRFFHCSCMVFFEGRSEGERLQFLAIVDSCICRFLCEKDMGNKKDFADSLEHLATHLWDELRSQFPAKDGAKLPRPFWDLKRTLPGSAAGQGPRSGGAAAAGKPKPPHLEPVLIKFDERGKAQNEQDEYTEEVKFETLNWIETLNHSSVLVEDHRAFLFEALLNLDRELMRHSANKVSITRSSAGELKVMAACDLARGECAFAPGVSSPSFISTSSRKGPIPATAVYVNNFSTSSALPVAGSPRSGGSSKDAEASVDDFIIFPCCRMPPRGVSCDDWEKQMWVHPFWIISRVEDSAAANMEMKKVEVQVVKTMAAGELDVGKKSFSAFRKIQIPVMVTSTAVKKGTPLGIASSSEKVKKAKDKTLRWDSRIKRASSKRTEQLDF